jgi:AcrR family transcriptional regulator
MGHEGRHRRDALANRQAAIEAAAEVLRENPDATMSEIAEQADISRSTIYRHFENREVLFCELVADVARKAAEQTSEIVARDAGFEETVRAIAELGIDHGLRYPFLQARQQEAAPVMRPLIRESETPFLAYMVAAQQRGEMRSDQPVRWIASIQNAVIIAMIGEVLCRRLERPEAVRILGDTLVAMAAAR